MPKTYEELLGFKKMQKVAKERLQPPNIIKNAWDKYDAAASGEITIASETSESISSRIGGELDPIASLPDSKLAIDFNAIANASEFRRFVYWIRTGQVFRGSNEKLDIELNKTQEDLDIVKLMKKQQKPIFMSVMNEYKNKVEKLRGRKDE